MAPPALKEMSGMSLAPSFGIPVTPDWNAGFDRNIELAPPPPAAIFGLSPPFAFTPEGQLLAVQLSFHTNSGMYFKAAPVELLQYSESSLWSLNSVPPTAVVNGVDAGKPTDTGPDAVVSESGLSQLLAPESPVAATNVIPCAAACSATCSSKSAYEAPASDSQSEKLSVITSARSLSTM